MSEIVCVTAAACINHGQLFEVFSVYKYMHLYWHLHSPFPISEWQNVLYVIVQFLMFLLTLWSPDVFSGYNSISWSVELVELEIQIFPYHAASPGPMSFFSNLWQHTRNCIAQSGLENFCVCSCSERNREMVTHVVIYFCVLKKFRWEAFFDGSCVSAGSSGKNFLMFQLNSHLCTSLGSRAVQVCICNKALP